MTCSKSLWIKRAIYGVCFTDELWLNYNESRTGHFIRDRVLWQNLKQLRVRSNAVSYNKVVIIFIALLKMLLICNIVYLVLKKVL